MEYIKEKDINAINSATELEISLMARTENGFGERHPGGPQITLNLMSWKQEGVKKMMSYLS